VTKDPVPIGEVLDGESRRFGMAGAREVGTLFASWEAIVGAAVAAHVEPVALRQGVLKLRADAPSWATEISYLREQIKEQANAALGRAVVTEVEVIAGPRQTTRGKAGAGFGAADERADRPSERPPTNDPMTAFERAFAAWRKRRDRRR
jgi:predicted nucleic acid-binding Zn ribbon protein